MTPKRARDIREVAAIIMEQWADSDLPTPRAFAEAVNESGWGFDTRYGHEAPGHWTRVEGCVLSAAELDAAIRLAEEVGG